jgi:hypothetical protein
VRRLDRAAALQVAKRAAAEGGMAAIRRLLADGTFGSRVDRLDDDAVLEQLAARIEAGQIVLLSDRRAGGVWSERIEVEAPPPAEPAVAPVETETTWIEFELIGEDDKPIAGMRYEATLPDGTVRRGHLDSRGLARIHDIPAPGTCSFSFPDLDQDAWEDA